tara:strand:- start:488 stop:697 length:210 start_codon:yes stop_codon:yes gene_type:complete
MEFKDRGSFGEQPIEKQLDLLGHGLSHTEGQLLSIRNLIRNLNLQKESLEKEKNTIIAHMERLDNVDKR